MIKSIRKEAKCGDDSRDAGRLPDSSANLVSNVGSSMNPNVFGELDFVMECTAPTVATILVYGLNERSAHASSEKELP